MKVYLNFVFLLLCINTVFSQSFKKNILVNMTGQNYDFDILNSKSPSPGENTYMSWVNKNGSVYTIFVKKISPTIEDDIVISQNTEIKSRTKIINVSDLSTIRISWQVYSDPFYKIMYKDMINGKVGTEVAFQDSILTEPQIELTRKKIIFIDGGKLEYKDFSSPKDKITLDSGKCASPNSLKSETSLNYYNSIIYEKKEGDKNNIYLAEHKGFPLPKWEVKKILDGNFSNPRLGTYSGLAMEVAENNYIKLAYSYFSYDLEKYYTTGNKKCNYKTPDIFTYPQVTELNKNYTPFFITFVSDSIIGDSEIFVKSIGHVVVDTLINISQMPGNDYAPRVCFMNFNDSLFASIIWLHQVNNQVDIWYAKTIYKPNLSSINNLDIIDNLFSLSQNYPNPFNPSTTICYQIPVVDALSAAEVHVSLKVYDVLGREVAILVNEYKQPGNYNYQFSIVNYQLQSGVYFYSFRAGSFNATKKMILVK